METGFDLIVIGGGPGGYQAAIRAAQLGMRVAVVEQRAALGGTCLNVGCIPSKALLDSSELYQQARHGTLGLHGVKLGEVALDLPAMMGRKEKVVKGLTQGIAGLFKKNKVTWVQGAARIERAGRVAVAGTPATTIEAPRILIATGSEPTPLRTIPFDGARIVSSTEALTFEEVPRRLLVVGGGAIGLELGSVWARLGAEVTVVEFLDRIVPLMDRGMGRLLQRTLERQGLRIRLETSAAAAEVTGDGVHVTLESKGEGSAIDVDRVLVAVGRRPYSEGLGAREAGVAYDERGRIVVNARFETSVAGIFAIGDVIPGPMLAHKAEHEGVAAVEGMAGRAVAVNHDTIPNVVYTFPELASVGLSEEDASARGHTLAIGQFPFVANARAKSLGETDGAVKVIADATTDRVLGVHILGPHASDLIAEAVVAMEFGASAEDLARTIHAHPTLAEATKEAALAVAKRAINI